MKRHIGTLIRGLLLTLVSTAPALAQDGRITGTVSEAAGRPLAAATVQVAGTGAGAITDANGRYAVSLAPGSYELRVSLIGFSDAVQTVTVAAGQTVTVDFVLSTRAVELGELLVSISATAARRAELGTAVTRFNAEREVARGAVGNISELLNARASGLSIAQSSGSVGTASTIRVRGSTSLTQDNNPIIYVDGIRVSNATGTGPGSFDFGNGQTISRLDDLNPQDIASIQVMKGPTAAALYGSEAAAGVILIETKQGVAGEHRFTFSTEQGIANDVTAYPDNYYNLTLNGGFTDIEDPIVQQWDPVINPATGDIYGRHNPLENPNTSPFRTGVTSNYTLSVRGGSERINYFSSLKYETQTGTLPNNELERYSFRANFEAKPDEKVDVAVSTSFVGSDIRVPDNDRSAVGMITNAMAGLPIYSRGTLPDGSPGDCLATVISGDPEALCAARQGNLTANFDKLATIENEQAVGRFIGGVTTRWRPVSWLTNRLVTGIDYIQTKNRNLVPLDPDRPFGPNSSGLINDRRVTERILSVDYAATASARVTSDISSTTTVGAQYFRTESEMVGCSGEGGFASTTAIACNAALTFSGVSDKVENAEIGALFQQRFGFNGYLFATGGIRVDDNSAFGENQGAIWSPSFNASIVLSEMPFWRVDPEKISNLRLRFAWGTAAQAPAPFAQARTFRPVRLDDGSGTQVTGISPLDPGNADLTAERSAEWEFGFDSGLLDDRVGLMFTYYRQRTTDAIVQTRVAPSTGFSGAKYVNLGAIENQGIEATLSAQLVNREDIAWEAALNLSTQDPVVTSLGGQPPILFGLNVDHQMFREGYAPGAYFGEVIESAERDANGDIIPESIVYAEGDIGDPSFPRHRYLGRAEPSNEQSLSTSLTLFGALRLYTLFDRAGGFVKLDNTGTFRSPFIAEVTGSRRFAMRQAESTPAQQAMMEAKGATLNALFIEDATFIKWRELTLAYTLPESVTSAVGLAGSASLTVGGRNLHTWTGYGGLDPELRYDGGRDSFNSAEFMTQPPARYFFVRLNFSF